MQITKTDATTVTLVLTEEEAAAYNAIILTEPNRVQETLDGFWMHLTEERLKTQVQVVKDAFIALPFSEREQKVSEIAAEAATAIEAVK